MKFRSYNLADLTYVDIGEYLKEKDTVLIPMASTEQHGPHLPLKTDTFTAEEVARRVVGVGALQPNEGCTVTMSVDVFAPSGVK